ncbi:unnamed protein product [Rotaria sp. Silwood1]|nr:unnamed protein product [Rotaria sp. Silwood1]
MVGIVLFVLIVVLAVTLRSSGKTATSISGIPYIPPTTTTITTTTTTTTTTSTTTTTTTTTSTTTTTTSTTTTTTSTTTTTTTTTATVRTRAPSANAEVCFDGSSLLMKNDGSWIEMRNLKIDDQVLVTYETWNNNIQLRWSPILAIDIYQKYRHHLPIQYLEIYTVINNTISHLHITPSHSLLVTKKYSAEAEYIFASEVHIGDCLHTTTNNHAAIVKVEVTQIKHVYLFDAYAPLTFEGNLIVNNVVVSCYGTFKHSIGHLIKLPRRCLLYYLLHPTSTCVGDFSTDENCISYEQTCQMDIANVVEQKSGYIWQNGWSQQKITSLYKTSSCVP